MSELRDLHRQIAGLLEIGRVDQARRLGGRALGLDPNDADTLCLLGAIEIEADNFSEATRRAREALARAPDHAGARSLLFEALRGEKSHAEAEAVILGLIRDNPRDADHLADYAALLLDVYQLDKARAIVAEALRCSPDHPKAQVLDALLHVIAGDDASASARLGRMVAADPDAGHVAMTAMVVLSERHQYKEALEIARELLRANPSEPELVDAVIELRVASHWSMVPLWPFQRGGWVGSAVMWVAAVFGISALRPVVGDVVAMTLVVLYLALVVYSWTGPPLLRRWLRWRGL